MYFCPLSSATLTSSNNYMAMSRPYTGSFATILTSVVGILRLRAFQRHQYHYERNSTRSSHGHGTVLIRLSTDAKNFKKVSRAGSRRKSHGNGHMQSGMELGATRYRKCQLLNKFR